MLQLFMACWEKGAPWAPERRFVGVAESRNAAWSPRLLPGPQQDALKDHKSCFLLLFFPENHQD